MKKFINLMSICTAFYLTSVNAQNITPPQLDDNSSYISTADDNLGNTYLLYQDGSDTFIFEGEDDNFTSQRGQLLKYDGISWNVMNGYNSPQNDTDVHLYVNLNGSELRQNEMVVDSKNKLHIAYIDYFIEFEEPTLAYLRYNPNSQSTASVSGWESQADLNNAWFTDGLDSSSDDFTPFATDLALDVNSSDTPILAYINKDDNSVHVRYLDDKGTIGTDESNTNFKDDSWEELGTLNITASEIDMIVDKDIPYLAYKDKNSGKVSVLKYLYNTWGLLDLNISNSEVSNIKLTVQGDDNLYLYYVEDNIPVTQKLRRYKTLNTDEESTSSIISLKPTNGVNISYSLDGIDKELFTISNDGNLSFKVAPSYETYEDNNSNGVYEVDVTIKDNDTNLSAYESFNISLNDIDENPILGTLETNSTNEEVAFDINLTSLISDPEQNVLTYYVTSNDINKATVSLDNNILTITPIENMNGLVDINITSYDGKNKVSHIITLDIKGVNDAPTSSNVNFSIDEDTNKTFSANDFNFSDIDLSDSLESIVISSFPEKGTLKLNDINLTLNQEINSSDISNLKFIPKTNENGIPYTTFGFKVNDGDLNSTSEYTATINVSEVDDAPILSVIDRQNIQEDFDEFNITLASSDVENDNVVYTVSSNNPSLATVKIVDGKIVVTPIANKSGVISLEVNATANGKVDTKTFDIDISSVNDRPSIDTSFSNLNINEDNGTIPFDINISDEDGDNLQLVIESNDTTILNVSNNWSESLTQVDYENGLLDFNLTTVPNANGIVKITLTLKDGDVSSFKSFTVDVNAVNDTPILSPMSDVIVYKNSSEKNVTLVANDVDGDTLSFNVSPDISTIDIIDSVSFSGDIMNIKIANEISGKTDLNITVTDGEFTASSVFIFKVLALINDSSNKVETGGEVSDDENKTIITFQESNITVTAPKKADENGSISHQINLGTLGTVTAKSDLNGSVVDITEDGVHTTYKDENLEIEVNATITGKATHSLDVNGTKTTANSEFIGAQTVVNKDSNGSIQIVTSVKVDTNTTVSVKAKSDGTAEHSVNRNGTQTIAKSEIHGASTTIKTTGEVQTKAPTDTKQMIDDVEWAFEAVAKTTSNGKTVTTFQLRNTSTGEIGEPHNTFMTETPYDAGNSVDILKINNAIYFKTTSPVTTSLTVE